MIGGRGRHKADVSSACQSACDEQPAPHKAEEGGGKHVYPSSLVFLGSATWHSGYFLLSLAQAQTPPISASRRLRSCATQTALAPAPDAPNSHRPTWHAWPARAPVGCRCDERRSEPKRGKQRRRQARAHRAELLTSSSASFSGMTLLLMNVCTTTRCTSPYSPARAAIARRCLQ